MKRVIPVFFAQLLSKQNLKESSLQIQKSGDHLLEIHLLEKF
jgi:hypothetical protein